MRRGRQCGRWREGNHEAHEDREGHEGQLDSPCFVAFEIFVTFVVKVYRFVCTSTGESMRTLSTDP